MAVPGHVFAIKGFDLAIKINTFDKLTAETLSPYGM